jgi:Lysine-specific metallo-endopeptidase
MAAAMLLISRRAGVLANNNISISNYLTHQIAYDFTRKLKEAACVDSPDGCYNFVDYIPDMIWINPNSFVGAAGNSGDLRTAGVILHEVAHLALRIEDQRSPGCGSTLPQEDNPCFVYGNSKVIDLAKKNPTLAIINAANYEWFARKTFEGNVFTLSY